MTLTDRELQIARHVRLGYTNRQIAAHLGLTHQDVKNRVLLIADKVGAHEKNKKVELATWYVMENR